MAHLMVRRAELALLDCDEVEVAAIVRLAWKIRANGGERRALALILLRDDLDAIAHGKEPEIRRRA
jgi:hypothetical protein